VGKDPGSRGTHVNQRLNEIEQTKLGTEQNLE